MSPGVSKDGKKALYNCKYCGVDLSDTLRIRNAQHSGVDLCLDCFSVGVDCWPHKRQHAYRVVEGLSSPLFDSDWGMDEELLLLEALEIYGPGNWTEIAEHVGRKDKFECRTHYFETYINSPTAPLPVIPTQLKRKPNRLPPTQAASVYGENNNNNNNSSSPSGGVQDAGGSVAKVTTTTTTTTTTATYHANVNANALEGKVKEEEMAGGKQLPSSSSAIKTIKTEGGDILNLTSPLAGSKADGNQVEITGYNVKRDEYEPEYDNDAEVPLAELEIRNEDSKEDRKVKQEMLRLYWKRQKERYDRRKFVEERGLLNVRKQLMVEKKRSKDEKQIYANMRVFSRFQSPEDHEELMQGLLKEQKLRQRIEDLKEYRRMGVLSLVEAELYEQDKSRRDSEREKLKSAESYLVQPQYKSSSAMRANRYFNRSGTAPEEENQVTSGSSRELQSLRISTAQGGETIPSKLTRIHDFLLSQGLVIASDSVSSYWSKTI